jgi:hypothetical protein
MITQTKATIYLSDKRGCTQKDWFRSYHTFNSGVYFEESRKPFGNLREFNDDTLKGGCTVSKYSEEHSCVLLMPVVGTLSYSAETATGAVEPGQVAVITLPKHMRLDITNPYPDELINFLQIRLSVPDTDGSSGIVEFDLDAQPGNLIPILPAFASIGKYKGRGEDVLFVQQGADSGVFVFVLEGAFEVQNRLLHPRDALALWNVSEVEFEALSNDAIILLLQVKL